MDIVKRDALNFRAKLFIYSEHDDILHVDFIGKKIGDNFYTTNRSLQEFFNDQIDTQYNFNVTITDITPHAFFCFEQLKRYFKLKTNKDLHQKRIEVFSYRNDLSQRRTTVEETLKLL